MSQLEYALYTTAQIRACEQQAPRLAHLNEFQLMLQAGIEAFSFILRKFPTVRHLALFCGSGNNAGDGYIVARLAHQHGLVVTVYQCKALEDLPNAAKQAALEAHAAGVDFQWADEPIDSEIELIVDALLGIGLKGPVYGLIAAAIQQINASGLPVVSLDIPSGLNADNGQVANVCVQATMTLSFIGLKLGMYTLDGPDYCGAIYCHHLQLESYLAGLKPCAQLLAKNCLNLPLSPRKKNSHKGDYGHVVIIGGGWGMPGAVALAAKAALRTGAGAVSIATLPEHVAALLPLVPEAMIWGIEEAQELLPLLAKASFCIIGPGLGESEWAKNMFLVALSSQLPMVIDASALRLLAYKPQVDDNWILTPHPGEAASLLACSTTEIQDDRIRAAALIQKKYGGVVVLKGTGTLVQTLEKNLFICPKGNPGMASAGMGDVLSGIIAGLGAQDLSLSEAAMLGVWLHAVAADTVTQKQGERGLLASDLINQLPLILNKS
ncbi:NAD(P)H-hydrate dehydratase [Legionella sp. km772]|uniref:NAD(P)H-hydrate dehydratase n=1 Tax=Legionella sp. km772 TaxID=2498111 RepID=UPI000F8D6477|nr:NAD(P)H-hydrate dehydratase [Legionella sp. km772]RUR12541.1 NAD(P)H-hydrate dehydratase [Legionella sp. km772]